jgi:hypothetical protein
LLRDQQLDQQVRRAALNALSRNTSALAVRLLNDFSALKDPLAAEVSAELKKAATAK